MADFYMGPTIDYTQRSYDVSGTGDDPLGIASISGFYGPGTYTAWFLTILASWVQILVHPRKKVDPNSWFYVLGMNWAAMDLFARLNALDAADAAGESLEERKKLMGAIAAPLAFVYWGCYHAIFQNVVVLCLTLVIVGMNEDMEWRIACRTLFWRRFILAMGMILPLTALATLAVRFPLSEDFPKEAERYSFFPALYWQGIRGEQVTSLMCALWGGLALLPLMVMYTIATILSRVQERHYRPIVGLVGTLCARIRGPRYIKIKAAMVSSLATLVSFLRSIELATAIVQRLLRCIRACGIGLLVAILFILFFIVVAIGFGTPLFLLVPMAVPHYFGYLIFSKNTHISESCFFMPCAPQSIKDWDQAFSLTAALVLLVCTEMVPAIRRCGRLARKVTGTSEDEMEAALRAWLDDEQREERIVDVEAGTVEESERLELQDMNAESAEGEAQESAGV